MEDNNDDVKNWPLPELGKSAEDIAQEVSLFGKPATWYNQKNKEVEQEDVEEQPQPLTIDDIEAIRQSAYDDGFNEGKEAGHTKGLEEGRLEGIASGHQEGLIQGLKEGLAEGAEKIQEQLDKWLLLLDRLHNPLAKLDDNAEYQLVRLATSLAEQITRSEVQTNPQIILQALKQAVDALPISEQKLIINLHPEDLNFVQQAYSPEQAIQRGWDLQAEPALKRGDCQIQTQVSSIDYAFDTRIEQVLKAFFKENYQRLPNKNDDSSLANDQPLEVETLPEYNIEALPEDNVEALPEDNVEALPEDNVEALPEENIEPLPEDNIEALPEDNVEPLPEKDAVVALDPVDDSAEIPVKPNKYE